MKATTTNHGKFKQSRVKMLRSDWLTYRETLADEQNAGRVFGWTCVPSPDGYVLVIVTHNGGLSLNVKQ